MNTVLTKQSNSVSALRKELTLLKKLIHTDVEQASNLIDHMELKLNLVAKRMEDLLETENRRLSETKKKRAMGVLGTRS